MQVSALHLLQVGKVRDLVNAEEGRVKSDAQEPTVPLLEQRMNVKQQVEDPVT